MNKAGVTLVIAILALQSEGKRQINACGARLETIMNDVCSYGNHKLPCYNYESSESAVIVSKCCNVGCTKEEIEQVCCFTELCLRKCYEDTEMEPLKAIAR